MRVSNIIRTIAVLATVLAYSARAAHAESAFTTVTTVEIIEEYYDDAPATAAPSRPVLAQYGPFNVVDAGTAEMIGSIDGGTPRAFAEMLAAHPGIARLVMVECPGSDDDEANLRLARMVRGARLATHVPAGGSVRSGAVELFLAGVRRTAEPGAEFAVHSWRDSDGMEADDVAASNPVHREYLDYYAAVGMAPETARAFYALTNSAPYDGALYLAPQDLAAFGLLDAG